MKKPTIFLSSTIYDFRDLRSALKHYLEQQGCEVLASEFNDFRKPLESHSYDACLAAMERADYFILLIGSRVGGWFDEDNQVSITQQEYRHAYELHRKSKLNIITFVRSEVWQVREDRKALERHLETLNLEEIEKDAVLGFTSKFATNSAFISSFIDEVGRNKETKDAQKSGAPRPTGNWIHVFRDFSEIIGVVQPLIFSGIPIEEAAFRKALEGELVDILTQNMHKHDGKVFNPVPTLWLMKEKHPLTNRPTPDSQLLLVPLPTKDWDPYSTVMMLLLGKREIMPIVLSEALSASTFFEFDATEGTLEETPVGNAIARLLKEIRLFNKQLSNDVLAVIFEYTPRTRPRFVTEVEIDFVKLAALYQLGYRWGNILLLTEAILHYLQAGRFYEPVVFPFSPVKDFDAELAKESLVSDDVHTYLAERRKPRTES